MHDSAPLHPRNAPVLSATHDDSGETRAHEERRPGMANGIGPPAAPDGEGETARLPEAARASDPLRVLVVDDEDAVRRVVVRSLRRRGHAVEEATEGARALELLERADASYDAIVSDLRMPQMSGAELLAKLRTRGDGMDRRLIFLTGDTAGPEATRILASTDVPVLQKPDGIMELARWVERVAGWEG